MTQYAKIYSDNTIKVSFQDTNSDNTYQDSEKLRVCLKNKCVEGKSALDKLKSFGIEKIANNCPTQELESYFKLYQDITHIEPRVATKEVVGGIVGIVLLPVGLATLFTRSGKSRIPHTLEEGLLKDIRKLKNEEKLAPIRIDKEDYMQKMSLVDQLHTPHLTIHNGINKLKNKISTAYFTHLCLTLFKDAKYGMIHDLSSKISDLEQISQEAKIDLPDQFIKRLTRLALDQHQVYFIDSMKRALARKPDFLHADSASYEYKVYVRELKEAIVDPDVVNYTDLNAYHQDVLTDTKAALLDLLNQKLGDRGVDKKLKEEIASLRSFLQTHE